MKKLILLMMLISTMAFGQVRIVSPKATTGTIVDTITFPFYVWELTVIFDESVSDTLTFWTEAGATSDRKIQLVGGEFITLNFSMAINRIYLQASGNNKKRRIIGRI